jgi:7-carboxy-7-deazaguanine synthase
MSRLQVTEIFHSIQGESTWAGSPCVFVRLTGCPLRCRWCDTAYAFSGGTAMEIEEILDAVAGFACPLVEITGGEPLAQRDAPELMRRLCEQGYTVLLETGGAHAVADLDRRVHVILDLKCPDSGESARNLWSNLDHLKPGDEVKFVLSSRRDYDWASGIVRQRRLWERCALHFAPVWGELHPAELARWILEDRLWVRMQVQIHKVIFGADARGV